MMGLRLAYMTGVVADTIPGLPQGVIRASGGREGRVLRHHHENRADRGMGTVTATGTDAQGSHERFPRIMRSVVGHIECHMGRGNVRRRIEALPRMREEDVSPLSILGSLPQSPS